jgi:hypothetical protein
MLDHHRAAPEIAVEGDEIKPILARAGTGWDREEISACRPAHVSQLIGPDRLKCSPEGGAPPGLDLDEGNAVPDTPEPEVSFKDRAAGKLQIERRDTLPERTRKYIPFHRRHPFRSPPR